MNQPMLLHIVERLEGFLGRLPERIQKPILTELTPLKELFLQQRAPRLLFTGSAKTPLQQILAALFPNTATQLRESLVEIHRWHEVNLMDTGTLSVLDTRGGHVSSVAHIDQELSRHPPDVIFFVDEGDGARGGRAKDIDALAGLLGKEPSPSEAKVIGLILASSAKLTRGKSPARKPVATSPTDRVRTALQSNPEIGSRLLEVIVFDPAPSDSAAATAQSRLVLSILARNIPNAARVEIARLSGDRDTQREIAQVLVKSTTAICTAIGAQPIPLADLPILTTLQLVMVSGIMYISGRERSLRAATEFAGALGANVGAGMLLREGARAILKFFPGWGNVVCGMVAGAGTYAMGRAATAYFLEGVTLTDARRTYLASRRKPARPALVAPARIRRNGTGESSGEQEIDAPERPPNNL